MRFSRQTPPLQWSPINSYCLRYTATMKMTGLSIPFYCPSMNCVDFLCIDYHLLVHSSMIFRQNAIMRFALMWWLAYAGDVCRRCSFITKWGSLISRDWFDLESPNFAWTFIPVGSTTTPDMTLRSEIIDVQKNGRKCSLWRLWVEFLENLLSEDHEILRAFVDNRLDTAVSGLLQNASKYCTKMRQSGAAGIEVHNSVTAWRKITSSDTLNLTEHLPWLLSWVVWRFA